MIIIKFRINISHVLFGRWVTGCQGLETEMDDVDIT